MLEWFWEGIKEEVVLDGHYENKKPHLGGVGMMVGVVASFSMERTCAEHGGMKEYGVFGQ